MHNAFSIFILLAATVLISCQQTTEQDNSHLNTGGRPDYSVLESLPVPKLSVGIGIESGLIHVSWTQVDSVDYYELEQCFTSDFISPSLEYAGADRSISFHSAAGHSFFRVRTIYQGSASYWSNIASY